METTAKKIVKKIQEVDEGKYTCCYCGGYVRDLVVGKQADSHDLDIATDCPIERLKELFDHVILVGESFGVIRVIEDEKEYEIANFRKDIGIGDGRRPDSVELCDMQEDAFRRDFTINGIFFDPISEEFFDFVGGKKDIENGVVRFIGDAELRLNEDFLRAMRYARFSARFGKGEYDKESFEAVKRNANNIHKISAERIREELEKGLMLPNASRYLDILMETGIMQEILPEVAILNTVQQSPIFHKEGDAFVHTKMVVDALNGESVNLKLSALLHDIGKSEATQIQEDGTITSRGHAEAGMPIAENILRRLKASNDDIEYICSLVRDHMKLIDFCKMSRSSKRKLVSKEYFTDLFKLHKADKSNRHDMFDDNVVKAVNSFLEEFKNQPVKPKPLIDGRDIIDLGIKQGREIGRLKEMFYDMQLEGDFENREQAFEYARKFINESE